LHAVLGQGEEKKKQWLQHIAQNIIIEEYKKNKMFSK